MSCNKLNNTFSYISEDQGYNILNNNWLIDEQIPHKDGIDPRLIRFLRDLLYHKIYKLKSCVPLYMKYNVKKEDWDQIINYIKKYNIPFFYKWNFKKN